MRPRHVLPAVGLLLPLLIPSLPAAGESRAWESRAWDAPAWDAPAWDAAAWDAAGDAAASSAVSSADVSSSPVSAAARLDSVVFGDPASEAAHALSAAATAVVDGALGEKARVATPTDPPGVKGGELRFRMRVDPVAQNYFTLKLWGGDTTAYKTIAYVNGEQIGYRSGGDHEPIAYAATRPVPGRFHYNTILLPLTHTQGRRVVEMTIRTYDGGFSRPLTGPSRGYYRAYTHTGAELDVSGERQGTPPAPTPPAPDIPEAAQQALVDGYRKSQIELFDQLSTYVDAAPDRKLSIVRYQDDLRFYASALHEPWCPAGTPELRAAAVARVLKVIDNHVKDYYRDTRLLLRGGHQGDWGGYYGALGEALYIVEDLLGDGFQDFLDRPFPIGTQDGPSSLKDVDWDGGELSRREAYERVLKANFDFARSRLSYIHNQVMYTYEGAWEAHEGLRVIGSRFYEGKARGHRIALEALGAAPFLGEEVLVGPDGRELDLYHSLFYHDTTARFTEDTAQIVGKGLARSKLDAEGEVVRRRPYGEHYTGISKAGLTRENTFVANYGEAANHLPEWFFRTLGHKGDERLNDEILKLALRNLHARGHTRHSGVDDDGRRVMRAEMVVDERNAAHPGWPAYALRVSEGRVMTYVALARHLAEHPGRYAGERWEPYRHYAREAVGFAQQQLADNQYFNGFDAVRAKLKYDLWLPETYAWLRARPPTGLLLPQTDLDRYTAGELAALNVDPAAYERFAFADVDTMFVSLRDGGTRVFGSLYERQRGFAGNGRLHVLRPGHEAVVQVRTDGLLSYRDYYLRMDNIDADFMEDRATADGTLPQALAGEVAPVAHQPGVGTVRRENFAFDTPYSGYADFLTARYGRYLFVFNTTRPEYGNATTHRLDVPSGAVDLVTGRRVGKGLTRVPPETAMVLRLDSAAEGPAAPYRVDFVQALRDRHGVVVAWKPAAGAEAYRVERDGEVIAARVRGASFTDRSGRAGAYTVTAVNRHGSGRESQAVTATALDRVGDVEGTVKVRGDRFELSGGDGTGFGEGDDYYLDKRDIQDRLLFANRVLTGSGAISARVAGAGGLMLRADDRYVYFGADDSGRLVLRNRTRDSRHDWQDQRRSPLLAEIPALDAAAHPHLKLVRDAGSQIVTAWAGKDGRAWTYVGELFTPFPGAVRAGGAAPVAATFDDVRIDEHPPGTLYARVERAGDRVTLHWSKPDDATRFTVRRKDGAGGAWREVLSGALAFSFTDEPLRHGTRFYQVTATGADGHRRTGSGLLMAAAEPLAAVIAEAERLPAAGYTRGSYHVLTEAIARARAGGDEAALIDLLYAAVEGLVPAGSLLAEVPVDPAMVTASTPPWGGGGTAADNGLRAFDGDLTTFTDTTTAAGWIEVRLAEPVALDGLRYHPRPSHPARLNGAVFQGSADGGATWTDLHTVRGVSESRWYEAALPETPAFGRLRVSFAGGNANVAEVAFLALRDDRTLLDLLLDEAAAVERDRFTEASLAALDAAVAAAGGDLAGQAEIDRAAGALHAAIKGLTPRP
ncbi:discoidin domain-containing protein [Nonomuraea candida]|uniref:discoidin domain-containing protein n=1 Tax=Nonomuraea candida TaxID=359159 RepID=UPI000A84A588|nr:discoidin domain-containing protein [Nonomuraea candida]